MEATITSKGQVTLPKPLRDILHLKTGDKVMFEATEDGDYILRPQLENASALKGCIAYHGKPKTLDEMQRAITQHSSS